MKSLQDYIDTFKEIADKLNLKGDSVEILTQLLANASYISEVENIAYAQEASLEKATLINSKIQHCVNDMYSVFRGACPRVILKFIPNKYFNFEMFQNIVSGNGFNIYYLGYLKNSETQGIDSVGTKTLSRLENFVYAPISIPPAIDREKDVYTIVGLLCKKTVEMEWKLNKSNTYYVDCLEDGLSNDMWVKVEGEYVDVTREFSDHIVSGNVFDLTLPSFGSRLYVADLFRDSEGGIVKDFQDSTVPPNTTISATYFKFSDLTDYNTSDLKRISIKGAELTPFDGTEESSDIVTADNQISPGVILMDSAGRDGLNTIHYKASRDRYVNTILRSNSDIGVILEEMYPDKVKSGGTSYEFTDDNGNLNITIWYVPTNKLNLLTSNEINDFISSRSAYYISPNINVSKGYQYTVVFTIDVELYQNTNVDTEVKDILLEYTDKFGVSIPSKLEEIKALISKISNVKQILSIGTVYLDESGAGKTWEDIIGGADDEKEQKKALEKCYFQVECVINSIIK